MPTLTATAGSVLYHLRTHFTTAPPARLTDLSPQSPSQNTASLNRARFTVAAAEPGQWPRGRGREVAFAGRSNVGKSSAINALTRRRGLARTSKTPGRTQQIVFFDLGHQRRLVDLPGYGYAKVPEPVRAAWARLVEAYLVERRDLAGLVLVMDARHPLTELDRHLLAWCEPGGLPVHILLTKVDKLSRNQAFRAAHAVGQYGAGLDNEVTVQQFSALNGTGLDEARSRILQWLENGP